MKRTEMKKYVAPLTQCSRVELEEGFMKASIVDETSNNQVESQAQEMGETFDGRDWTDSEWK